MDDPAHGTAVNALDSTNIVAGCPGRRRSPGREHLDGRRPIRHVRTADFTPEFLPALSGEVMRSCLDVSRARLDLALLTPTPLADGLATTLDWVRKLPMYAQDRQGDPL